MLPHLQIVLGTMGEHKLNIGCSGSVCVCVPFGGEQVLNLLTVDLHIGHLHLQR